jgi:hypothetical protein
MFEYSQNLNASNYNSTLPAGPILKPFIHEIWPNDDTLPTITNSPILFLSGLKDSIVP